MRSHFLSVEHSTLFAESGEEQHHVQGIHAKTRTTKRVLCLDRVNKFFAGV